MLIGDESELLAGDPPHGKEGLDVVHHGVGLGLFVEARLLPVLALVVGVPLCREIVGLDQLLGQAHHAQRLREALHGIDGERADFFLATDLEVTPLLRVRDVAESTNGEGQVGFLLLADVSVHLGRRASDELDRHVVLGRVARRDRACLRRRFAATRTRCFCFRGLPCSHYILRLRSRTSLRRSTTRVRSLSSNPKICCNPIAT